ncbi:hypothetical protein HDV00_003395 [Rhizophlyctis rosea]|nr:hypothetical protein HDV00_003395 [Rhizophlyctis rosea]
MQPLDRAYMYYRHFVGNDDVILSAERFKHIIRGILDFEAMDSDLKRVIKDIDLRMERWKVWAEVIGHGGEFQLKTLENERFGKPIDASPPSKPTDSHARNLMSDFIATNHEDSEKPEPATERSLSRTHHARTEFEPKHEVPSPRSHSRRHISGPSSTSGHKALSYLDFTIPLRSGEEEDDPYDLGPGTVHGAEFDEVEDDTGEGWKGKGKRELGGGGYKNQENNTPRKRRKSDPLPNTRSPPRSAKESRPLRDFTEENPFV